MMGAHQPMARAGRGYLSQLWVWNAYVRLLCPRKRLLLMADHQDQGLVFSSQLRNPKPSRQPDTGLFLKEHMIPRPTRGDILHS